MADRATPSQPRVGVVIRTRDRPGFVTRALQTVLDQTYPDWCVALVNDGGDASVLSAAIQTAGLTDAFTPDRLLRLDLPSSVGRSEAFNRGVAALTTELVCCLDDDDTWTTDYLTSLTEFYDRTRAVARDLGGVAALVVAKREDLVIEDGIETLVPMGEEELPQAFRRRDFFLDPVAYVTYRHDLYPVQWMLDRAKVQAAGGFPAAFSVMEDRAFMTRFLQHWRLAILDRPLAHHHRRIRRKDDTAQSVAMNTLDNPSYDWRLYSDLAKVPLTSPEEASDPRLARQGAMVRAAAATIVKEINDETSGLWHKVNGEGREARHRYERLEQRLGIGEPVQAEALAEARCWSVWDETGPTDMGFPLGVGTPFLKRLTLSMDGTPPGILMHGSAWQRRLVVQIPSTGDWCALEVSLEGLAKKGEGLRCEVVLSAPHGYLLETSLSRYTRDRLGRKAQGFTENYVHALPPGRAERIVRDFPASLLDASEKPKLSIALPRMANDFRFVCHDLVVSRL
nr:glycosyltransferase family A protein [Pararhodobacter sp. CCB-MM2]